MIYFTLIVALLALTGVIYIFFGPLKDMGYGVKKLSDVVGQLVVEIGALTRGR
jgi:hypothetical protein